LLLRDQLVEVTLKWGTEIHRAFHRRHRAPCSFAAGDIVLECWHDRSIHPRSAFLRWSSRFMKEFERIHLSPLASCVRRYLNAHYKEDVDVRKLARELGSTGARVGAEFRKAYGISPSHYQRQLRVGEGLRLLKGTNLKVEAVAQAVGYRSKKNFYQVTRAVTGTTPTSIRNRKRD
jgi:AraC-like DNA-binding protein